MCLLTADSYDEDRIFMKLEKYPTLSVKHGVLATQRYIVKPFTGAQYKPGVFSRREDDEHTVDYQACDPKGIYVTDRDEEVWCSQSSTHTPIGNEYFVCAELNTVFLRYASKVLHPADLFRPLGECIMGDSDSQAAGVRGGRAKRERIRLRAVDR